MTHNAYRLRRGAAIALGCAVAVRQVQLALVLLAGSLVLPGAQATRQIASRLRLT